MRSINSYIEKNFSEKRRIHTFAVCELSIKLANHYGLDSDKAETAALFHDMFRDVSEKSINCYVKHLGLDSKYLNNPNLAHGKIAAAVMERDYGITDRDVINAVSYHTTGREAMSEIEKIIYIADATEPNRSYPIVEMLRKLSFTNLDKAVLESLTHTITYIEDRGLYLDNDTVLARDYYKKKEKINE
jgi:predicted HD superfamily hydrolase involved in NAD metabolism